MVRRCEAPIHAKDCSGEGVTKDHLTPRSVARLLDWKPEQLGDKMNLQYLSPQCHREKDATTPQRIRMLKRQLNGKETRFGKHQKVLGEH